ncbi:MAG TPA: hypothetical protein VHE30_10570 [Polyangiaceae bacterium]|nr:hypothetical protein [Polyangiaceae bacterium]
MSRCLAWVSSGLLALFFSSEALAASSVAVVVTGPGAEQAARYLETQIDHPVVRRESVNSRHLDALVAEARAGWHEELVVVVDTERAVVSVLRPGDGTIGSRRLDESAATAPYAVALAAVELLEIVESAPPARAAALKETRATTLDSRVTLDVGLVQSVSLNGEVGLFQPTAGIDWVGSDPKSSGFYGVGLHGTGILAMNRDQAFSRPPGVDPRGNIRYLRNELSLRPIIGHRHGPASALGWMDVGLAVIDVTARSVSGEVLAQDSRVAFWLGLSGELRYTIGAGWALGLGAGAAWFPVTSRFYPTPRSAEASVPAFVESPLELRARATVVWEIP